MCDSKTADFLLAEWGRAQRKIASTDASIPSLLGRIRKQGLDGAAQCANRQVFSEVFSSDALLARRALEGAPEMLRDIAAMHYVVTAPAVLKAKQLGLGRAQYWQHVNHLRHFVAGAVDGLALRSELPRPG